MVFIINCVGVVINAAIDVVRDYVFAAVCPRIRQILPSQSIERVWMDQLHQIPT